MRLSFLVHGGELVSTIEEGTLFYKKTMPFDAARVALASRELLVALARGNRVHHISESNLRDLRQIGGRLAGQLLPPEIVARLDDGDRERELHLQVDETLVAVPWELLFDGERFFCQRFDLGRVVATPQPALRPAPRLPRLGALTMLVICADPRGDLDHVVSEGEALCARLDQTKTVDAHLLVDPPVETVRSALKTHDLIHFAGHADHDPQTPESSGWQLVDGKLTAKEIVDLAGGRDMPLLVFSNACRSSQSTAWEASDDSAQVYGLANAFLLGGVRLYIGTQWEVIDAQSADFAVAFYEALSRGASAGAAVRMAREAIAEARGASSLAWASYVLYGDPGIRPLAPADSQDDRPPMVSASALEARKQAPWKRPASRYTSRSSVERRAVGRTSGQSPAAQGRGPGLRRALLPLILVAVALVVVVVTWRTLEQRPAPTRRVHPVGPLEPGAPTTPLPQVALLMAQREGSPAGCLRAALSKQGRFRLIASEKIDQLANAEGVSLGSAVAEKKAAELGQSLSAEFVVFLAEGAKVVVTDVLTGQQPIRAARPGRDCRALAAEMVRVLLGEGEVIAVEGDLVQVNLGWRSRVAPGATLDLLDSAGAVTGALSVKKVELDRSSAKGKATIGQRVRIAR